MRFVLFTFPDPELADRWLKLTEAEREAEIEVHRAWFATYRNQVQAGEELGWPRTTRTVRRRHGEPVVTDGPFVETKEILGGFVVVEVDSIDDAVAMAAEWPSLRHPGGAVEVQATAVR